MGRIAVVLGATGLVGRQCLRLLAADAAYTKVVTLARREMPEAGDKHEQHRVDFDRLPESAAFLAGDDLYCCLGTTISRAGSEAAFRHVDYELPLEAAELARDRGVQQLLLVSSVGASPSSRLFYTRVKGELERELKKLGLAGLGIFRPSLLLGDREERRPGEVLATLPMKLASPALRGPLARYRPIQAQSVAQAMIHVAKRGLTGCEIFEGRGLRNLV